MNFLRIPKRVLALGALGAASLAGAGGFGLATIESGHSALPVLHIQNAAADAPSTTAASGAAEAKDPNHGGRKWAPLDEATAAKVKRAALEAVPGATVDHVGHDHNDGYQARLTKSDGATKVAVHEDSAFTVTKVQDPAPARDRHHRHDHQGHHGHHGHKHNDRAVTSTTAPAS